MNRKYATLPETFNRYLFSRDIILCLCLSAFLLFMGCEQQQETQATEQQVKMPAYEGTIIAMGDSLTAGLGVAEEEAYPALLERKLQKNGHNWQVINAGISGETSSGMVSRINWIASQSPDIIILETGANDGFRGIPVSLVKDNIRKAVQLLKEKDIEVVLAGMQIVQNLGAEYTKDFAAIYPAVAEEQKIILIPFFLENVAGVSSLSQSDSIHPTAEGYRIVTETVYPYVLKALAAKR